MVEEMEDNFFASTTVSTQLLREEGDMAVG